MQNNNAVHPNLIKRPNFLINSALQTKKSKKRVAQWSESFIGGNLSHITTQIITNIDVS